MLVGLRPCWPRLLADLRSASPWAAVPARGAEPPDPPGTGTPPHRPPRRAPGPQSCWPRLLADLRSASPWAAVLARGPSPPGTPAIGGRGRRLSFRASTLARRRHPTTPARPAPGPPSGHGLGWCGQGATMTEVGYGLG